MSEKMHVVLKNDEEQYSLWPDGKVVPAGWEKTGFSGSVEACKQHVDSVWTDMRPRSLREKMAEESEPDSH